MRKFNQMISIFLSTLIAFIVIDLLKPNPIVGVVAVLPLGLFVMMAIMVIKAAIVSSSYYLTKKVQKKKFFEFMHYAWAEFMDGAVFFSRASREAVAAEALASVLEEE